MTPPRRVVARRGSASRRLHWPRPAQTVRDRAEDLRVKRKRHSRDRSRTATRRSVGVRRAIATVARERFVPLHWRGATKPPADDQQGQTISQTFIVALCRAAAANRATSCGESAPARVIRPGARECVWQVFSLDRCADGAARAGRARRRRLSKSRNERRAGYLSGPEPHRLTAHRHRRAGSRAPRLIEQMKPGAGW